MLTKAQFLNEIQRCLNPQQGVRLVPDARVLYSALVIRDAWNKNVINLHYDGRWRAYALYREYGRIYQFQSEDHPSLEQAMDDVSEMHLAAID